MEIKGNIFKIQPIQTGNGKNGTWQKQDIIIETEGKFKKKVCITLWGADMIDRIMAFSEGEGINIYFNIESREYNDRWFTEVKAWKIASIEGSTTHDTPPDDFGTGADDGSEDLPF